MNRFPARSSPLAWCWRGVCAVAFISGITGQFYRQFALTIAVSTLISAFNSLTLSPALLGPPPAAAKEGRRRGSIAAMGLSRARFLVWL